MGVMLEYLDVWFAREHIPKKRSKNVCSTSQPSDIGIEESAQSIIHLALDVGVVKVAHTSLVTNGRAGMLGWEAKHAAHQWTAVILPGYSAPHCGNALNWESESEDR
jgi:hypothetical protein